MSDAKLINSMVPDSIRQLSLLGKMDKVANIMYDINPETLPDILQAIGTKLAYHKMKRRSDVISLESLRMLARR